MTQQTPPPMPVGPVPPQYGSPLPPRKNWWGRNWKWVVPVGCLTPIVVCGGFVTLLVTVVFGAMRSSDAYRTALATAQANPAVVTALGTPVESGWMVMGSINVNGSSGKADLAIPIHGPKGAGTVYAVATKSGGQWQYSKLEVQLDGGAGKVNLLPSKP